VHSHFLTGAKDPLGSSYHAYLLLSKGTPKAGAGAAGDGGGAGPVVGSTMVLQTGEELLEVTEG
jgi:hypothetical protein